MLSWFIILQKALYLTTVSSLYYLSKKKKIRQIASGVQTCASIKLFKKYEHYLIPQSLIKTEMWAFLDNSYGHISHMLLYMWWLMVVSGAMLSCSPKQFTYKYLPILMVTYFNSKQIPLVRYRLSAISDPLCQSI